MKLIILLAFFFFYINSNSQNVGIGTTTPAARLQVNHGSALGPGILLKDSTANFAGLLRFQSLNLPRHISLSGFYSSNTSANHFLDINSDSVFIATFRGNGNVGIGDLSPSERLDVNGNINITGTIKANGTDGQPNQVLMKNTSGNLAWGDICDYKNTLSFTADGSWTIPAGVTKIVAELWGQGGYGSTAGGAGGGGYLKLWLDVTPGLIVNLVLGLGGCCSPESSSITYAGNTYTAHSGSNSFDDPLKEIGYGGRWTVPAGFLKFIAIPGENGKPTTYRYEQTSGTSFVQSTFWGNGGSTAFHSHVGGTGGYLILTPTSTQIRGASGKMPGGGGAGYPGFGLVADHYPGQGLIIIHY